MKHSKKFLWLIPIFTLIFAYEDKLGSWEQPLRADSADYADSAIHTIYADSATYTDVAKELYMGDMLSSKTGSDFLLAAGDTFSYLYGTVLKSDSLYLKYGIFCSGDSDTIYIDWQGIGERAMMYLTGWGDDKYGIVIDSNLSYGMIVRLGDSISYTGYYCQANKDTTGGMAGWINCVSGFKFEPAQRYINAIGFWSHMGGDEDTLYRIGFLSDGDRGFVAGDPAGNEYLQLNRYGLYDLNFGGVRKKIWDAIANTWQFPSHVTIDSTLTVTGRTFHDEDVWMRGDTLFFTDGGADTSGMVQNGTSLDFFSDNYFSMNKYLTMQGNNIITVASITGFIDTTGLLFTAGVRGKELWGLRLAASSPDKSDSCTQYYDASGVFHIKTDSSSVAAAAMDEVLIHGNLRTTGAVKPAMVYWDLLQDGATYISGASGSSGGFYGSLQGATADSVIIDSIGLVYATSHNDVYVDSVNIVRGLTRNGNEWSTYPWGNGTNLGVGTTEAVYYRYTSGFPVTVSVTWRMRWNFFVETSGTAGDAYVYTLKIYGHYK